jgi:UDP-N-acetyl-D-glucosamine dehydrogenase
MRLLQEKGAEVVYHDPFCPEIRDDGHTPLSGLPMRSAELSDALLHAADCVVIVTDHSTVDYARIRQHAPLIVDTRGIMRGVPGQARVVGLSGQEQNGRGDAADVFGDAATSVLRAV